MALTGSLHQTVLNGPLDNAGKGFWDKRYSGGFLAMKETEHGFIFSVNLVMNNTFVNFSPILVNTTGSKPG